jgi:hypothetical protein
LALNVSEPKVLGKLTIGVFKAPQRKAVERSTESLRALKEPIRGLSLAFFCNDSYKFSISGS